MAIGENIIAALDLVRDAMCDLTQELAGMKPTGDQLDTSVTQCMAEIQLHGHRLDRQGKTLEGIVRRQAEIERDLKDVRGTVRLMIAALFDETETDFIAKGLDDGKRNKAGQWDRSTKGRGPIQHEANTGGDRGSSGPDRTTDRPGGGAGEQAGQSDNGPARAGHVKPYAGPETRAAGG